MVSINQNKTEPRTVADVVCPFCFKSAPFPGVSPEMPTSSGIRRRGYQCWCPDCNRSAMVIQFLGGDEKWHIEKFIELKEKWVEFGDWVIVDAPQQQPEAQAPGFNGPIIMTGPGGDYTKSTSASQADAAVKEFDKIIAKLVGLITNLNIAKNAITK